MSSEADYLKTAKKYIPNLTEDQEQLVRRISRCKKYGAKNKFDPLGDEMVNCGCHLCLQIAVNKITNPVPKKTGIIEGIKRIYFRSLPSN